ncbi:pentapeptide repeat-containing protein, partial [Argonema antarcticum]|uniref:pentapeptide repeat-containing protein n=1 Tax=Argonema antarcticum TaxID=2942763 RepID=UPI002012F941
MPQNFSQDFSNQNLQGRFFQGQNLAGANFSRSNIQGANFANAILTNANFSYTLHGHRPCFSESQNSGKIFLVKIQ